MKTELLRFFAILSVIYLCSLLLRLLHVSPM